MAAVLRPLQVTRVSWSLVNGPHDGFFFFFYFRFRLQAIAINTKPACRNTVIETYKNSLPDLLWLNRWFASMMMFLDLLSHIFADRSIADLTDWFKDGLTTFSLLRLNDPVIDWLIDCLVDCFIGRLINCLIEQSVLSAIEWVTLLFYALRHYFIKKKTWLNNYLFLFRLMLFEIVYSTAIDL